MLEIYCFVSLLKKTKVYVLCSSTCTATIVVSSGERAGANTRILVVIFSVLFDEKECTYITLVFANSQRTCCFSSAQTKKRGVAENGSLSGFVPTLPNLVSLPLGVIFTNVAISRNPDF